MNWLLLIVVDVLADSTRIFIDNYVSDYYFRGEVSAKESDLSWIYRPLSKKEHARYVDNPILKNISLLDDVSRITGLDEDLFISIVVVNTQCEIKGFESKSKTNFLVHINKLHKLIETIESRDVSPLKDKQLYYAVQDIARLNLNKNKKK